jgi:aspartyl-tRNA(Asn)/glutamyl-tRNA(Gln) amidotransferase subunit A
LYGIPFSMKDAYLTKGIKTTTGSKVLEEFVPNFNATVYQKILNAGGVLIGKTNQDPWGHGSTTENSDFGPVKNPWNTDYVPGGSSGGSAASVATHLAAFDIAEDTGGSIRLPANFCGVPGLKVSYGLVSRYGATSYASSLDTVGPIGKTVEDIALIMEAIAGNDPYDATTVSWKTPPQYTQSLHNSLKGMKIGLPKEYFVDGIDPEVRASIENAIEVYKKLGVEFKEISLPMTEYAIATYYLIATSETSSNLGRYDGIRYGHNRSYMGPEQKRRIMLGTFTLSAGYYDAYYLKAAKIRTLIKQDFQKAFAEVDAIIAPVSPTPAFKIGEKIDDPLTMYLGDIFTVSISLAGMPSLAVPSGFTKSGLPLGFQIIGNSFQEEKILNIGHQYEREVGGFTLLNE